jgi:hypothetical protein
MQTFLAGGATLLMVTWVLFLLWAAKETIVSIVFACAMRCSPYRSGAWRIARCNGQAWMTSCLFMLCWFWGLTWLLRLCV